MLVESTGGANSSGNTTLDDFYIGAVALSGQGVDPELLRDELLWANTVDLDIQRKDYSISAGYAMNDRFSIFLGYKKNTTDWKSNRVNAFAGTSDGYPTTSHIPPYIGITSEIS